MASRPFRDGRPGSPGTGANAIPLGTGLGSHPKYLWNRARVLASALQPFPTSASPVPLLQVPSSQITQGHPSNSAPTPYTQETRPQATHVHPTDATTTPTPHGQAPQRHATRYHATDPSSTPLSQETQVQATLFHPTGPQFALDHHQSHERRPRAQPLPPQHQQFLSSTQRPPPPPPPGHKSSSSQVLTAPDSIAVAESDCFSNQPSVCVRCGQPADVCCVYHGYHNNLWARCKKRIHRKCMNGDEKYWFRRREGQWSCDAHLELTGEGKRIQALREEHHRLEEIRRQQREEEAKRNEQRNPADRDAWGSLQNSRESEQDDRAGEETERQLKPSKQENVEGAKCEMKQNGSKAEEAQLPEEAKHQVQTEGGEKAMQGDDRLKDKQEEVDTSLEESEIRNEKSQQEKLDNWRQRFDAAEDEKAAREDPPYCPSPMSRDDQSPSPQKQQSKPTRKPTTKEQITKPSSKPTSPPTNKPESKHKATKKALGATRSSSLSSSTQSRKASGSHKPPAPTTTNENSSVATLSPPWLPQPVPQTNPLAGATLGAAQPGQFSTQATLNGSGHDPSRQGFMGQMFDAMRQDRINRGLEIEDQENPMEGLAVRF